MDNKGSSPKGSFMLLRLLLPTLLLCSNGGSLPLCLTGVMSCGFLVFELLDDAVEMARKMEYLSHQMYLEIYNRYALHPDMPCRHFGWCHTSSIPTPESWEQIRQMDEELILTIVLKLLRSWNDPLIHLFVEAHNVPEPTDGTLLKAKKVDEGNKKIMEGLEMIINKIDPGAKKDETYVAWSGIRTPNTEAEDNCIYAFHNLLRCLHTDSHKVKTFINFLMCQIVYNSKC